MRNMNKYFYDIIPFLLKILFLCFYCDNLSFIKFLQEMLDSELKNPGNYILPMFLIFRNPLENNLQNHFNVKHIMGDA